METGVGKRTRPVTKFHSFSTWHETIQAISDILWGIHWMVGQTIGCVISNEARPARLFIVGWQGDFGYPMDRKYQGKHGVACEIQKNGASLDLGLAMAVQSLAVVGKRKGTKNCMWVKKRKNRNPNKAKTKSEFLQGRRNICFEWTN